MSQLSQVTWIVLKTVKFKKKNIAIYSEQLKSEQMQKTWWMDMFLVRFQAIGWILCVSTKIFKHFKKDLNNIFENKKQFSKINRTTTIKKKTIEKNKRKKNILQKNVCI